MTGRVFSTRRLLLALPLAAFGCSAGIAREGGLEQAIESEAEKLNRQGISDSFVIGVVKQGRTWVRGFGDRPGQGNGELTGDSLFQIGSLTKLFTVATLMSLAEDGIVSLDDDLARLLGGQVPLSQIARAITLRQLASHTSGLPSVPQPLMALPRDDADPYRRLDRQAIYQYLRTAEGLRPPGRIAYSNYGIGLLGHVLESKAGASLESLMAARIFGPLSMSSTFMTPIEGPGRALTPGASEKGDAAAIWRFGALGGAGALCSSVNDMLAFARADLAPKGPLKAALAAMRHERGPDDARLGWMAPSAIDRLAGNGSIVWHNGRVGGYASYLSIDATRRTGVVILSARSAELTMSGVMLSRVVREYDWSN